MPLFSCIAKKLVPILAAGFLARFALIVAFKTYAHPTVWEYEHLANNLLAGHGYSFRYFNATYSSYATPLYAFLCAGVYAVTNHSYLAVLLIQCLFSTALALTIFNLAKTIFDQRAGLLAAAIVAFHPGLVYYDAFNLLPLSIDCFLIALIALLLVKITQSWKVDRSGRGPAPALLLMGALIGTATLFRGITGVLLVLIVAIFLIKRQLRFAALVVAATLLVLSPWLIRNHLHHRQLVFSTSSAELFWRGNNAYATGTSFDQKKVKIFHRWPKEFKDRVYSMNELEQKEFFENEAWSFIRDNPTTAGSLYLKKVFYFWWFSPQSGIIYPKSYLTAYKVFYAVLLIFSIVGAVFALRSPAREPSLILIAIVVTICLGQSLFYVEGRHRWLVEPLMIIFFSHGVMSCWRLLSKPRRT